MNGQCLSEIEEQKIERLSILLNVLGKKEITYFVNTWPFRFDSKTQSFYSNAVDLLVSPNSLMIDIFYNNLCIDATVKMRRALTRSKIPELADLLIYFHQIDFLRIFPEEQRNL